MKPVYNLISEIKIHTDNNFSYIIDSPSSVEIESSYDLLTDTCKIILSKSLTFIDNNDNVISGEKLLKEGLKVEVKLAYDSFRKNVKVFKGYINRIKFNNENQIELFLEDEMYTLKVGTYSISYKETSLQQILEDLWLTNTIKDFDFEIENWRIPEKNLTAAQVLEALKKDFGIHSYYKNENFYSGLIYEITNERIEHDVILGFDTDFSADELEYKNEDDTKLVVKATAKSKDKKVRNKVEVGDVYAQNFEVIELNFKNTIISEDKLKQLAEDKLKKNKFTGFKGSISVFGHKIIEHGEAVNLIDPQNPEKNGKYLVKSVTTSYNSNGYRQKVFLDIKLS